MAKSPDQGIPTWLHTEFTRYPFERDESIICMAVLGHITWGWTDMNASRWTPTGYQSLEVRVEGASQEICGKCGAEIDPTRRVDFTLKNGTRVCDSCFVKETPRPSQPKTDWPS